MEVPFIAGEKKQLLHELKAVLSKTRVAAQKAAEQEWGLEYGGLFPGAGQYGETSLRLRYFGTNALDLGRDKENFDFNFSTTGWTTSLIDSTVIEDVYLGVCGFAFGNSVHRVQHVQMEAGGQTMGVLDVEEVRAFEEPIVIFKNGMVVPEKMPFKLHASVDTKGRQQIYPIGFAFVKKAKFINRNPT